MKQWVTGVRKKKNHFYFHISHCKLRFRWNSDWLRNECRFEGKVKSLNRNYDFDMLKCVLWSSLNFNVAWLLKSFMTVHSKNLCSRQSGSLQTKHLSSDLILYFLSSFLVTNIR